MKKIFAMLIMALCMIACNNADKQLSDLEKACESQDLEKAEKIFESIDASKLTPEQHTLWEQIKLKMNELKEESCEGAQEVADAAEDKAQDVVDQAEAKAQEAIDKGAQKAADAIEQGAQKATDAILGK